MKKQNKAGGPVSFRPSRFVRERLVLAKVAEIDVSLLINGVLERHLDPALKELVKINKMAIDEVAAALDKLEAPNSN